MNSLQFAELVDSRLHARSGAVFYTGQSAFSRPGKVYLLGLNPGGSPTAQAEETIGLSVQVWLKHPERWSAYRDESWRGAAPGSWGMQPRILHMFSRLGLDIRDVPASNVVFVRSNREAVLASEKEGLLGMCWPVHRAVIETLGVSTILCLGKTAGKWVRSLVGAREKAGEFTETNSRRWRSEAHLSADGLAVLTLTHPGIADWRNPASDPTPLVEAMLRR
jgi:hypothetical protein